MCFMTTGVPHLPLLFLSMEMAHHTWIYMWIHHNHVQKFVSICIYYFWFAESWNLDALTQNLKLVHAQ